MTPRRLASRAAPTRRAFVVPDSPKMLRETLCVAQARIAASGDGRLVEHIDRLGRLIAECDRHRPLGPDGTHGDRHTQTCGCPDRSRDWVWHVCALIAWVTHPGDLPRAIRARLRRTR